MFCAKYIDYVTLLWLGTITTFSSPVNNNKPQKSRRKAANNAKTNMTSYFEEYVPASDLACQDETDSSPVVSNLWTFFALKLLLIYYRFQAGLPPRLPGRPPIHPAIYFLLVDKHFVIQ